MKKLFTLASLLIVSTTFAFSMTVAQLNKANKDELMKINGVGAKKAQSIIDYRKTSPFKKIEDVQNVKGIGEALSNNIKNDVLKGAKKTQKDTKDKKSDKK